MLAGVGGPAKATIFYAIALGLAFVVAALSGIIGEASPLVTMVTPALAVLVMMLVLTPEGWTADGWRSLGLFNAGLKGWWLAILGPAAILVGSYAILIATGLALLKAPVIASSGGAVAINLTISLLIGLAFAFTEEVGWRGYMLSRLATIGLLPAMLVVGFLHGVWHLPLLLLTPYYHAGANMLVVVPLFLVTLTLAGVFYGYLFVWTGSVWPVAIAHAVYNFVWSLGRELVTAKSPETMEYLGGESGILVIIGLLIGAIYFVPRLRGTGGRASAERATGVRGGASLAGPLRMVRHERKT
jgi:membrane protease YdiL (CAAX protease family)